MWNSHCFISSPRCYTIIRVTTVLKTWKSQELEIDQGKSGKLWSWKIELFDLHYFVQLGVLVDQMMAKCDVAIILLFQTVRNGFMLQTVVFIYSSIVNCSMI